MKWLVAEFTFLAGWLATATIVIAFAMSAVDRGRDAGVSTAHWRGIKTHSGPALFVAIPIALSTYTIVRERRKLAVWLAPRPGPVLFGIVGGLTLVAVGSAYEIALRAAGIEPPDVGGLLRERFTRASLFVVVGLLAPLGEELYFRGRLLDAAAAPLGVGGAALVSSLAFALLHGSLVLAPIYVILGLLLVLLRVRTGGLLASIVAHSLNNVLGVAFL